MRAAAIVALVGGPCAVLGVLAGFGLAPFAACQRGEVHGVSHGAWVGEVARTPLRQTVRVALTFTRVGRGQGLRFEGTGHFPRYATSEADRVLTLLGLPDDDSIRVDTCRVVDAARDLDRALGDVHAPADVKLLDGGRLQVRGPSDSVVLSPRHYPELTPFVAGVVYGNEEVLPISLALGGIYDVSSDGGEAVGPFTTQVQAPRAFASLDVPAYFRGTDLELKWQADPDEGEATPPALLVVSWNTQSEAREVRCRVRDDGRFAISRADLAAVPAPGQIVGAQVALTRTRRAQVSAPGAASGEVLFSLRDVVGFPVASWPVPGTNPALPSPPMPMPMLEGER